MRLAKVFDHAERQVKGASGDLQHLRAGSELNWSRRGTRSHGLSGADLIVIALRKDDCGYLASILLASRSWRMLLAS